MKWFDGFVADEHKYPVRLPYSHDRRSRKMPGLVVRKDNGELKWYPLFKVGSKYTFYPSGKEEEKESGREVGSGWNFLKYLPGYWMPSSTAKQHRRIGGGSSIIVLDKDGDMKHYPFVGGTFKGARGAGDKVGRGFKAEWDYYVAEWTGQGASDLLVRDEEGHLRLFPWDGSKFRDLGFSEKVGEGFDKERFPDLYAGYWNGGAYPDILAREKDGDLYVYPFNGKTFKEGKPRKVGRGFGKEFTHLLVDEWMGVGTPAIVARHKNGKLTFYRYGRLDPKESLNVFGEGPYPTVGQGFKENWVYIVGHWRNPGSPDLIVCDDDHNMRFYPWDGGTFVDLHGDEKMIGKGWKFTHFWDLYP
jgi:hypothetical protein